VADNAVSGPIGILLADARTLFREALRLLLDAQPDLEVIAEVGDGVRAIALARRLQPEILLLDRAVGGTTAFDVARLLGEEDTRIVVLTSDPDPHEVPQLLRLGVKGYLSTTASSFELFGALRAVHTGRLYVQAEYAAVMGALTATSARDIPTRRQLEVLRLTAEGLPDREIAARLCITERTVRFHLSDLFGKLRATSRTHLVRRAHARGWVA